MYERILVPVDGSPASAAAALHALDLASRMGSELSLLEVLPPYQLPVYLEYAPPNLYSEEEYLRQSRQGADRLLARIVARAEAAGVKSSAKVVFQPNAAQAITDTASESFFQLIVMGSHGRSGLSRMFLGSVTSRVLPLSHIPVLVHRATEGELATAEAVLGKDDTAERAAQAPP